MASPRFMAYSDGQYAVSGIRKLPSPSPKHLSTALGGGNAGILAAHGSKAKNC
ncbi:MAG: hypothetical protein JRF35_08925 [Deltaproteobacteria bacterium]|nr:hypothetical protein [Deltaproteobacteria bacterium]